MVGLKKAFAGIVAAVIAAAGVQSAFAVPTVSVLSDTGTLTTTTYAPPSSTSSNSVPSPYGSGSMSITNVTATGFKVTFSPSSGFMASANNLAGGKTSVFAGLIAFDVTLDSQQKLTANIFEDGIYSSSGTGARVGVNSPDLASGVVISQLDNLLVPEQRGTSFANLATTQVKPTPGVSNGAFPSGSGTWSLYSQVTGFSQAYTKYHVVIDNDLIAEALANPQQTPGFAAIAKKDFSIVFTFDGSSGGGPQLPEPASLGVLALGGLSLLARRRK